MRVYKCDRCGMAEVPPLWTEGALAERDGS